MVFRLRALIFEAIREHPSVSMEIIINTMMDKSAVFFNGKR